MNNDNFETNKSVKSSVNEDIEKVNEGIIKDTKKEILKETLNKSGNSSLADNLDALDTLEAGSEFIYYGFKYFEIENELKEAQKEYLYYDSIPNPTREQRKEREKARTKYNNCLGNYVKSGSEVASSGASVVSNIVNAPPVVSILAENMVSGLSSAFGTALSNFIFSITKNVSEKEKIMTFLLYEDSYEEYPTLNIVRKGKENAKQSYDPLVIDIDDDGFDMKETKDGVYFDLDEKGFKEKTTWIDKKDGILSLDLNKDGEINKGSEIFGDTFIKKDGAYAKSSIDALASYDENNDGVIDENDKIFDELLVWQDINGDGISDIDEIKKLSEYKIISINLNEKQGYERNINGSILKNTITYTKINYENNKIKGKIGEFVLEKDNIDVITEDLLKNIDKSDVESKALAEKIKKLPNIRAFSRVNTLHNEMFLDKTGQLIKLVEQFSKEISIDKKDEIIDNILIKIGKAESIDENERGQYINGKYVKVLV